MKKLRKTKQNNVSSSEGRTEHAHVMSSREKQLTNLKTKQSAGLWFIVALLFLSCSMSLSAQVTIGDETPPHGYSILEIISNLTGSGQTGGLRLPQLATADRDALSTDNDFENDAAASGLAIFNIETQCYEYWNGQRWVSLCEGGSRISINPAPCTSVSVDGTSCTSTYTVSDLDFPADTCSNGSSIAFSFTLVSGGDIATLYDINGDDGTFKINFLPNNSIYRRLAIVRVISSCTGLAKDFMFAQEPQTCDPAALSAIPVITAVPSDGNLCTHGAVNLSVDPATSYLSDLVWTHNGKIVAQGVSHITATQIGTYDVSIGYIGCTLAGNAVSVTSSATVAPDSVSIIVKNNGMLCDPTAFSEIKVTQTPPSGSIVWWYKDGEHQSSFDGQTTINAGIGNWYAVVNDGVSCYSKPSNTVTVSLSPSVGTQLDEPDVDKVGNFCAGSTIYFWVKNYDPSCTYDWYVDGSPIGNGLFYLWYNVPSVAGSSVTISCRVQKANSCANENWYPGVVVPNVAAAAPTITGTDTYCIGETGGTLTATVSGPTGATYTYNWFKDNVPIPGVTGNTCPITNGGYYSVTATEDGGGCTSDMATTFISTSSAPVLNSITPYNATPNINERGLYSANITSAIATGIDYTWSADETYCHLESPADSIGARVTYIAAGTATVTLQISNECGNDTKTVTVPVGAGCSTPTGITPATSAHITKPDIYVGATGGVQLGKIIPTFASSPSISYQWYTNTSDSNSGGTQITDGTGTGYYYTAFTTPPTTSDIGPHYYFCEVWNSDPACSGTKIRSGVYTVNVTSCIPPTTLTSNGTKSFTVFAEASVSLADPTGIVVDGWADGGSHTPHYQWYRNTTQPSTTSGVISAAPGSTANSAIYTVPTTASTYAGTTYYYFCKVSSGDSGEDCSSISVASDIYTVTVNCPTPVQANVTSGGNLTPPSVAQYGTSPVLGPISAGNFSDGLPHTNVRYQWYCNTTQASTTTGTITTATGATATTASYSAPTSATGTRFYFCKVSNSDCTGTGADVYSSIYTVVVTALDCPGPVIQNGVYVQKTAGYIPTSGANSIPEASLSNVAKGLFNVVTSGATILCLYSADQGANIDWNNATTNCKNGTYAGNAGSAAGWRLPTIAEQANMDDNGLVLYGLLGHDYWSSTEVNGTVGWIWHFNPIFRAAGTVRKTAGEYVRCVKSI